MRVNRLRLRQFRNIQEMDFAPGPGANIIFGDNAQGKTNLLEAVWLFTGARSFRGAKDGEYLRFGGEAALLDLEFSAGGRDQTAFLSFGEEKKQVKLNEIKQRRIGSLNGEFCVVAFSPDHLSLVKQGPEKRRNLLDTSLCQAYPKYGKVLDGYQKALKQRNSLLKDVERWPGLLETLDSWDHALAEYGSYLTAVRAGYVRRLSQFAVEVYSGISGGKEAFSLSYASGMGPLPKDRDRRELKSQMEEALRETRSEDIRLGSTGIGPHRDDLEIRIDGRSARSFGSQGQQRSCILAIKLAECGILEERNGEPPVVMLDDVMSELDEHRRNFLLNHMEGRQVLITCCDAGDFSGLRDGTVFRIRDGTLERT